MRILNLKFNAFGPFSTEQTLDFSVLNQSELFLITGDTGAGKTSIFDAISFALFGEVSGGRKSIKTLKSDFAKPEDICYVELLFESNAKTYQIRRTPEQLKPKRGGDFTTIPHKAELTLPDGVCITNLKQIKQLIEIDIIGIDCENFSKIVMLPQGQFHKLLTEKSADKTATFREIFGTEIFQRITAKLFEKTKMIEQQSRSLLEQNQHILQDILTDDPDLIDQQQAEFPDYTVVTRQLVAYNKQDEQQINALSAQLADTIAKEQKFQNQLAQASQLMEQFSARQRQYQIKAQLGQQQKQIDELVTLDQQLAKAEKLNQLRQSVASLEERATANQQELTNKTTQQQQEQQHFLEVQRQYTSIPELEQRADELKTTLQQLEAVRTSFQEIKQCQSELSCIVQQSNVDQKALEQLNFKKEYRVLSDQLENCNVQLSYTDDLQKNQQQLIRLEQALHEAQQAYQEGCRLFFEEQAAHLAQDLQDGQACPVCGSMNHPDKATALSKGISQAEVIERQKKQDKLSAQCTQLQGERILLIERLRCADLETSDIDQLIILLTQQITAYVAQVEKLKAKITSIVSSEQDDAQKIEQLIHKLDQHQIEKAHLDLRLEKAIKKLPDGITTAEQLENNITQCKQGLQQCVLDISKIRTAHSESERILNNLQGQLVQLTCLQDQLTIEREAAQKAFSIALTNLDMSDDDYQQLHNRVGERAQIYDTIEQHRMQCTQVEAVLCSLEQQLVGKKPPDMDVLTEHWEQAQGEKQEIFKQKDALGQRLAINRLHEQNLSANLYHTDKIEQEYGVAKRLTELARGGVKRMSFEKFVLASYFDDIISFANLRLEKMSNARYVMSRIAKSDSDGLDVQVFDNYTGRMRHITTLSGGETFLASLALSLGLADVVSQHAGGIQLNTMFIDEGFGTLDSDSLGNAINCLVGLQNGNRLVGIISHVPELKERIKSKLVVSKTRTTSTAEFILMQ